MAADGGFGQTVELFHADEEVLIQLPPQNSLGVGVVLVFVFVSADGNDGVLRRCSDHLQQLYAAVRGRGHGHRLQVGVLRKIELEAEIDVGVGGGREISVFGILSSNWAGGGETRIAGSATAQKPVPALPGKSALPPTMLFANPSRNPPTIVRLCGARVNAVGTLMCDLTRALG